MSIKCNEAVWITAESFNANIKIISVVNVVETDMLLFC